MNGAMRKNGGALAERSESRDFGLSASRIPSSVQRRAFRALRRLRYATIPYYIDHLLAARIDPRDTLVVSGFWRSGTTWLQESLAQLLKAKTVFEPFHFTVPAARELFAHYHIATKDNPFLELYLPYCGDNTLGDPLRSVFNRALRSDLLGRAVRHLRGGVAENFRRRVVLKFVRAPLCLRAAQNTFKMPVLHIYRDPRAIVASIKKTDWDWLFDHLWLQEQLLEPRDGRVDFFGNWRAEILEYDKRDPLARVTAYWALTEKFVQHCYTDMGQQARIAFVGYEELCQQRERILLDILMKLKVGPVLCEDFRILDVDSRTTSEPRRGASVEERVAGWKNILSNGEIAIIESIVQRFGFADRLVDER